MLFRLRGKADAHFVQKTGVAPLPLEIVARGWCNVRVFGFGRLFPTFRKVFNHIDGFTAPDAPPMDHQLMLDGQPNLTDPRGNQPALTSQGELTKFHAGGSP